MRYNAVRDDLMKLLCLRAVTQHDALIDFNNRCMETYEISLEQDFIVRDRNPGHI